jgi:hypothetical protein
MPWKFPGSGVPIFAANSLQGISQVLQHVRQAQAHCVNAFFGHYDNVAMGWEKVAAQSE